MGRDRPQSAGWRRSPGRSLSVRRSSTSSRQSGAGKSWFLRAGLIARLSATRRISLVCRSCARSRRMDGVELDLLCPCGYEIDEGQETRCDAGGECVHGRREYAMDAQAGSRLRRLLRAHDSGGASRAGCVRDELQTHRLFAIRMDRVREPHCSRELSRSSIRSREGSYSCSGAADVGGLLPPRRHPRVRNRGLKTPRVRSAPDAPLALRVVGAARRRSVGKLAKPFR